MTVARQIRAVRNRLMKNDAVRKVPLDGADIFLVRDFLTESECERFIELIDADRQPSGLMLPIDDPDFRTSETSYLRRAELVVSVERRIDALLGIGAQHGEPSQGQRYGPGQQFKPHHDFFHEDQPYWPPQRRMGGQRTWTAMANLDVPTEGGKTFFPVIGLRISPRRGNLIVWSNLDTNGRPNHATLHQGEPVEAGVKHVLTRWYRERRWQPRPRPTAIAVTEAALSPQPA